MKTTQLDLFTTNYAESGNTNQLFSAPGGKPFVEGGSTDGCDLFLPAAGNRNNGFSLRCAQEFAGSFVPSFPIFRISREQLLIDLFKAYYDARKHKRNTRNQLRFEVNLEENLVRLRDELLERTYKVGRSTCFIIEDPVKREIFAADFRDRVVHHLMP